MQQNHLRDRERTPMMRIGWHVASLILWGLPSIGLLVKFLGPAGAIGVLAAACSR